jgi:uncharacterized damage-inducible protein DinB
MTSDVGALFTEVSYEKLDAMIHLLARCMERLSDEQVWERGGEYENAVGNLILHLDGNIRQWILHGIGGQADVREREEEFSARGGMSRAELMERFLATVEEAKVVIARTPAERMFERISPQPGRPDSSVLGAIYMVVGHVQQHVGQVVVLTKQLVRTDLDLTIPRVR